MPKQKESRLQRAVRFALEHNVGGVWSKIHGGEFQEPGIADLLGCVCGLHIEVEVKRDQGELRPSQLLRRWRIKNVGGGAFFIARSPEQAVRKVADYLRANGKTVKNPRAGLPGARLILIAASKDRRPVYAAAHWKDLDSALSASTAVGKRVSSRRHRLPEKRNRRLAKTG